MLTTKNGGALFGKVPPKKEPMINIKLNKACVVAGASRPAGWIGPCPQSGARYLISTGKAVAVTDKKERQESREESQKRKTSTR